MQSERPGSSIVELDEYLVCGAPDGGEVPHTVDLSGLGKRLAPSQWA